VAQFVTGIFVTSVSAAVLVLGSRGQRNLPELLEELNVFLIPLGTLTTLAVAMFVPWLLFAGQTGRRLGWRNPAWRQWIGTMLLIPPLAVIASEVSNWATEWISLVEPSWMGDFRQSSGELFERFVRQSWWLVLLGGCLFPGIGEEVYFRGFLSRGLVARHGAIAGTLLASLLFAVVHLDPVHGCSVFLLGVGLQYVFLTTRSLLAPIVMHTLNNAAALAMLRYQNVFPVRGLSSMPDGTVAHTPPLLVLTAMLCLAAVIILLFRTRTRWILPDGSAWSPGYVTAERPSDALGASAVSSPAHWSVWVAIAGLYAALIASIYLAHLPVAA